MSIINIVSIICFALCLVIFFYLKWYIKKRTSVTGLEERQIEVARLIAEIDRITDRDSQLVEERINQLKILLEDTDKRISVYIKELEKSRNTEALYTSLGRGIRAALATPQEESVSPPVSPPVSPSVSPNHPAPQLSTRLPDIQPQLFQTQISVEPETEPAPLPPVKPPSKKQIRAHIDLLLNEGLTPSQIASRLEISAAEVNLAMNLRRKK